MVEAIWKTASIEYCIGQVINVEICYVGITCVQMPFYISVTSTQQIKVESSFPPSISVDLILCFALFLKKKNFH